MCSTSINLTLHRHPTEDNYRLDVRFKGNHNRTIVFDFIPSSQRADEETCVDLLPINSRCQKKFLKNTFKNEDVKNLSNQLKLVNTINHLAVFVLDVKDSRSRYENADEIRAAEDQTGNFFRGDTPKDKSARKDLHLLVHENRLAYFLREGSLKSTLIKKVFQKEAEFLQADPFGKERLCQICEVLMNGLKRGRTIQVDSEGGLQILSFTDFIVPIHREDLSPPFGLSTKLQTLYPAHYAETYGQNGEYYQTISQIFQTTHEVNNGITSITIE